MKIFKEFGSSMIEKIFVKMQFTFSGTHYIYKNLMGIQHLFLIKLSLYNHGLNLLLNISKTISLYHNDHVVAANILACRSVVIL